MPRFYFEKLVRDKVLDRCLEDPKVKTTYRVLGNTEFVSELIKKVQEEAAEIPVKDSVDEEVLEEVADLRTAVKTLQNALGITDEDLEAVQQKKDDKNGVFEQRAYIEFVDLEEDSEWVEVFRKQPEKYREE